MNNSTDSGRTASFGFWARLPLFNKLLFAFGVLIVFVIVVAVVTLWGMNRVQTGYVDALAKGVEMRRLSSSLQVDLLSARRAEKNFLLRWQEEGYDTAYANYVVPFQQDVQQMREHIADLNVLADVVSQHGITQEEYVAIITSLNDEVGNYEQAFLSLTGGLREKGQDENSGLQEVMRSNAAKIEGIIAGKPGAEQLTIDFLQIRRREKDYLARGTQEYVDEVHKLVASLKSDVAVSESLSQSEKNELAILADDYKASFDAIVAQDALIAQENTALIDAARAVEPLAQSINDLGVQIAADDVSLAETSAAQTITSSVVIVLAVTAFSVFLALWLTRQLTNPLFRLTETVREIASGKFETRAEVTTADELGTLAHNFNLMTARLDSAFGEIRVRAEQLATVARISTETATLRDPFQLVSRAVHLTQRGFGLYHCHVFSYEKETDDLHIVACGYKEGDEHEGTHGTTAIPLSREQSLVARAARTRRPVIVNDVRSDPGWLPNPLLPDTRAELAVPMIVGEELVGVLDVQSEKLNVFTEEDAAVQMTLAAQIATSLQNARLYTAAQAQAELEMRSNLIGQRIQRAASVEEVLQTAIRELGQAVGASRVKAVVHTGIHQPETGAKDARVQ